MNNINIDIIINSSKMRGSKIYRMSRGCLSSVV